MSNKKHKEIPLLIIFLIFVTPTIYGYAEHTWVEAKAFIKSNEKGLEYKATKQLGEALLFGLIALGYLITAILISVRPQWKIPYLVVLVGTVAVVTVYYFRIYGIPIPFTDIIIRDLTTDWRDVITKIPQQVLVIPVAMMLKSLMMKDKKDSRDTKH